MKVIDEDTPLIKTKNKKQLKLEKINEVSTNDESIKTKVSPTKIKGSSPNVSIEKFTKTFSRRQS